MVPGYPERAWSDSEPVVLGRRHHRLDAVVHAELAEDLLDVGLDRVLAQVHLARDLPVREAPRHEAEDGELRLAEGRWPSLCRAPFADPVEDPARDLRRQHRLAAADRAHVLLE